MYFVICDLSKINNMYRFSLSSYLQLFRRALESVKVSCSTFIIVQFNFWFLKSVTCDGIWRFKFDSIDHTFVLGHVIQHIQKGLLWKCCHRSLTTPPLTQMGGLKTLCELEKMNLSAFNYRTLTLLWLVSRNISKKWINI